MAAQEIDARLDALIDLIVGTYAPLLAASLRQLVGYLGNGTPQWRDACRPALLRARACSARGIDGVDWLWPDAERVQSRRWQADAQVRLLTPFDPGGVDRQPFRTAVGLELPLRGLHPGAEAQARLLRDAAVSGASIVIGWGNLSVLAGTLQAQLHYVAGRPPQDAAFDAALEAELARMTAFLGLEG